MNGGIISGESIFHTEESFDAEWFDFGVDQQPRIGFDKCRCHICAGRHCVLGLGLLHNVRHNAGNNSDAFLFRQMRVLNRNHYLWISDIFACTVRLSRVTIGNGTVGSGCCVVPTGLLLMVSNRAAIGRAKKSGFVEYALHSKTIMKSVPIVNVLFVIIVCCKNLEGIANIKICQREMQTSWLAYSWCFFSDIGTCRCKFMCSDWAFLLKWIQMHVGAIWGSRWWWLGDLLIIFWGVRITWRVA